MDDEIRWEDLSKEQKADIRAQQAWWDAGWLFYQRLHVRRECEVEEHPLCYHPPVN